MKKQQIHMKNSGTITSNKRKVTNPNVVTYDGTIHPRERCRKIGERYYLIGDITKKDSGQCYLIDGVYYKHVNESSSVQWNYTKNIYTNNLSNLVYGYVNKNEKGYFEYDKLNSVMGVDEGGNVMHIMNIDNLPNGFSIDYVDGMFKPKSQQVMSKPVSSDRSKPVYRYLNSSYYGFGEDPATEIVKETYQRYINENVKPSIFDKFFFRYTYGLEIETDAGWLPEPYYFRHGALPLKDGSIFGTEVTTFPYNQNRMFNNLATLMKMLAKYTKASFNTSLHVNIGNIRNTPEFRVAIWILYCRLQNEIESFIPMYKRDQRFFNDKRGRGKDHCRFQESLDVVRRYTDIRSEIPLADAKIRKFLNEGSTSSEFVKDGAAKWDQRTRYYALNMLPAYFVKNNNPRIEFRVHGGTVNPIKTICWTLICGAMVKYAEERFTNILEAKEKIYLSDVIEYSFNDKTEEGRFLVNYLNGYIATRISDNILAKEKDDIYGEFQGERDNEYIYRLGNSTILNYEEKGAQSGAKNSEPVSSGRF